MRAITEDIEECHEGMERALAGCYIGGKAYRDPTPEEAAEFDRLADLVPKLRTEAEQTHGKMRQVVSMSRHPSSTILSQSAYTGDQRVLPTNGILPGDEQQRFRPFNRIAKLKAFKGPEAEPLCYAGGMFLRAVLAREFGRGIDKAAEDYCARLNWQVTNVGTEGIGSAGGYTVPAPLSSVIIDVREEVGIARRAVNVQPMTSDTLSIPKHASGLTVYYPGEAQAITLSDKGWQQIQLIAKKRAVAHQLSQELNDDSILNMIDHMFKEMAYALADKEDAEFINGDGTSTYGGVTGVLASLGAGGIHTAATGHETWPEIDLPDITSWMALLPSKYHARNPKIICSSQFYYSVLLRVAAAAGGNTLASLTGGPGGTKNFLGTEVLITPYMPTATAVSTVHALFGAFDAGVILAERTPIRVARSDDYAFLNDVITLKATSRYDINVHDPGTASVPGTYVGLKTPAS